MRSYGVTLVTSEAFVPLRSPALSYPFSTLNTHSMRPWTCWREVVLDARALPHGLVFRSLSSELHGGVPGSWGPVLFLYYPFCT